MTPDIFATLTFPTRDQFEMWQAWYGPVFDVLTDHPARDAFDAEIDLWNLGGFAMSRTTAPPVRIRRSKNHIRRDPVDHWVISYCARGAHSATTAGVSLEVPARVPFLWSLGQEFVHDRTHVDRIQFLLARDVFRDVASVLDTALGSALDTPLGHVLGDYMTALLRRLPDLTEADLPRLNAAVAAMVGAAVAPTAERVEVAKRQIDLGRAERVRQAVHRNLRTPTLEPETLSRLVGMSRSNLYRLFEGTGGVARYIQRQRLLEAHAILTDPANSQSIAIVAEDLCFADATSFSRAFKREFGCSPSEARSAAVAGWTSPAARHWRTSAEGSDFGELLRGF